MTPKRFRLNDPPLIFVLAQVVMSPVRAIHKYSSEIQDRLRKSGFPHFDEQTVEQLDFHVPTKESSVSQHPVYRFGTADRRTAVILNEQSVVLGTSRYNTFDTFTKDLKQVLEIIHDVTEVSLTLRRGLRYVNLIRPDAAAPKTYLKAELLGLADHHLGAGVTATSRHVLLEDHTPENGTLLTRIIQTADGSYLPPDLDASHVTFPPDTFPERGDRVAILDLDHFTTAETDFDPTRITREYQSLHDRLEDRFVTVVTKEALKTWGHHEVEMLT